MKYRWLLLGAFVTFALGAAYDTDGDGVLDYQAGVLRDDNCDGSLDFGLPGQAQPVSDSLEFGLAWTSGSELNNQWDAACGDFDNDARLEILGHHFNPNELHVFESDGSGGYQPVWQQTESLPPASYVTVTAGDPDDDGDIELLGGDCSTLGKVVVFELTGADTWGQPYAFSAAWNERIRTVRVGDTDQDDTNEIIVVTGNTDGGGVYIFEHTGAPGVPGYALTYHYATVSYLFQAEIGDADNDGYPEVLIGVGGMHGYPMYIRRIVYDPGSRSYSHKLFESSVIGLHISPLACDVDSSGFNELVVGSSGAPDGQMHVFKYSGNDTFQPVWSSGFASGGNIIAVQAAQFEGFPRPIVFGASFAGSVYGIIRDETAFHVVGYINPGTGSAIRSIDAGRDVRDELVLAESAPADYVSVFRRLPGQGVFERSGPARQAGLHVAPNPVRGSARIFAESELRDVELYDCQGRRKSARVQDIPDGSARYELNAGSLAPGIYIVRARTAQGIVSARFAVSR
jgi:hypothetical protein